MGLYSRFLFARCVATPDLGVFLEDFCSEGWREGDGVEGGFVVSIGLLDLVTDGHV